MHKCMYVLTELISGSGSLYSAENHSTAEPGIGLAITWLTVHFVEEETEVGPGRVSDILEELSQVGSIPADLKDPS